MVAVVGWFAVVYPNLAALPLPSLADALTPAGAVPSFVFCNIWNSAARTAAAMASTSLTSTAAVRAMLIGRRNGRNRMSHAAPRKPLLP